MRFLSLLAVSAVTLALSLSGQPAMAAPQNLVVGSGWQVFGWNDGVGPIDNPADGFQVNSPNPVQIKITDAFIPGDVFDLFVDGILQLTTSTPLGGPTTSNPDVAYGSSVYSWGSIVIGSGLHDIDISVNQTAPDFSNGEAFIRADIAPNPVPEPASMALLTTGALPLLRRLRRRRQTAA